MIFNRKKDDVSEIRMGARSLYAAVISFGATASVTLTCMLGTTEQTGGTMAMSDVADAVAGLKATNGSVHGTVPSLGMRFVGLNDTLHLHHAGRRDSALQQNGV